MSYCNVYCNGGRAALGPQARMPRSRWSLSTGSATAPPACCGTAGAAQLLRATAVPTARTRRQTRRGCPARRPGGCRGEGQAGQVGVATIQLHSCPASTCSSKIIEPQGRQLAALQTQASQTQAVPQHRQPAHLLAQALKAPTLPGAEVLQVVVHFGAAEPGSQGRGHQQVMRLAR